MASTQKTGGRPTGNKGRTQTQSKTKAKPKQQPSSTLERVIGGFLFFLLAVFVLLGALGVDAVVISLLSNAMKGLIGYGFWLTIPAFLLGAYLLFFRMRERVAMRIACGLALPILFGALFHVFLAGTGYTLSTESIALLWDDGLLLKSGGAVSGFLAVLFSSLFSGFGASLIFLIGIALLVLAAFHITPETIVRAARNAYWSRQAALEEAEEAKAVKDEPEKEEMPPPIKFQRKRRQVLDLPVDDPPLLKADGSEAPQGTAQPGQDQPLDVPPIHTTPPPPPVSGDIIPAAPITNEVTTTPTVLEPPPVEKELTKKENRQLIRKLEAEVAESAAQSLTVQEESVYEHPPLTLLHEVDNTGSGAVQEELTHIQKRLSETIRSFGIEAKITGAVRGPSITRYEVELEQGVRLNKLTNLSDDIALALGAASVRIAPVPGKISLVGIEVPNQAITPVWIREVLSSSGFSDHKSKVSFAVGKDIGGNYIVGDAAKLPHLLIAGTTGSGKSVCTNSLIISMLYKASPDEVKLIMVDPKMVELGIYNGIPHLLIPVVTDPKKAAGALQWAVTEMMKRYRIFSEVGVRELSSYNSYAEAHEDYEKMPQIVIVIDELADLMLVAAKEVEESICRVAQMGRAAGMHLIIATQRPSADVITGLMKANIPSRIAFAVASSLESRIILDTQGAEKLVGKGDMLWFPLGSGKPLRVQGCLIDDKEVASVVEFVKQSGSASYDEAVLQEIEQHAEEQNKGSKSSASTSVADDDEAGYDELFPNAVEIVLELGQASVSMLQRRLKLGYSRAARLVDQMEDRGIVGPFEGSKPRQLLINKDQWDVMQNGAPLQEEPDDEPTMEVTEDIYVPAHASVPYPEEEPSEAPPWDEESEESEEG